MVRSWWFESGMSSCLWRWSKDKAFHKDWPVPGYMPRDLPVRSPSALTQRGFSEGSQEKSLGVQTPTSVNAAGYVDG